MTAAAQPGPSAHEGLLFGIVAAGLLAAQPLVGFLDAHRYQLVGPVGVLAVAFASSAVASAVVVFVHLVARGLDPRGVGLSVGVVFFCWWTFESWPGSQAVDDVRHVGALVFWLLATAGLAYLAYRLAGSAGFRLFVLIAAAVGVALPLITTVGYRVSLTEPDRPGTFDASAPLVIEPPNVYWFVLDEYARPDIIESMTGADVDGFVEDLETRGFDVSPSSWAGYTRTQQSITSTLSMDYAFTPEAAYANEYAVAGPVMTGDSAVADWFRAHGYRYIYAEAGLTDWAPCRTPPADVCVPLVREGLAFGETGVRVLRLTPLGSFAPGDYQHSTLDEVLQTSGRALEASEPFFLFAHLMSPHWPYRYDETCGLRTAPPEARHEPSRRLELYENELRCLNPKIVDAVDEILDRDPDAIVVIQGDHGSAFGVDFFAPVDGWSDAALEERLAAFSAMRLPEQCRADTYSLRGRSIVNTFRVVTACLEGRAPDLLAPRAFVSELDDISTIAEVPVGPLLAQGP